jgi:proteic killer suppression protein
VIQSFKNKELAALWSGRKTRIDSRFHQRLLVRLGVLNEVTAVEQLNMPGYDFHALKGFKPTRYTIHVNGPWCITFEFENGDAFRVDFDQYR